MLIDIAKHFLTRIKLTVRVLSILLIVISFTACRNQEGSVTQGKVNTDAPSPNLLATQLDGNDSKNVPLSQDMDTLVSGKHRSLSISQHDGVFIPASSSFTQRMIDVLGNHDAAIAKESGIDDYDLVLRFEGYKDIHVNLKLNTFWFAEADQLYPIANEFSNQWDRYSIHVVDGEMRYDTFEKTILRKTPFTREDGTVNMATLFYDGDIRLSINDSQVVVDSNVSEESLSYYDSVAPSTSYLLQTVGEQPLIAVTKNFSTVKGPSTKLNLYTYIDQSIQTVFSTSEMKCELKDIDLVKSKVTIDLPFANTTLTYPLTSEERGLTEEKMSELKENNVNIDEEYIKSVKDTIYCVPIKATFAVANGVEEMLISTKIQSIGARTPLSMNTNVVFRFVIKNNLVQYKEATFVKI